MKFAIACAVDDDEVFERRLRSCPAWNKADVHVWWHDAPSAAFVNVTLDDCESDFLVYAHQDVVLPEGWLARLERQWEEAQRWQDATTQNMRRVAVAGVYGVKTVSPDRRKKNPRAGHLLDRGRLLREPALLPTPVDSLDECVVAISVASGLRLDPALGWHFWATDLCLQAQERGMVAVAVDAYCEHWSSQSRDHAFLPAGYAESREVFRKKWRHRLPIETPSERVEP